MGVSPITHPMKTPFSLRICSPRLLLCMYNLLDERIMHWTSCAEDSRSCSFLACVVPDFSVAVVDFGCHDNASRSAVSHATSYPFYSQSPLTPSCLTRDIRFVPVVKIFRADSVTVSYGGTRWRPGSAHVPEDMAIFENFYGAQRFWLDGLLYFTRYPSRTADLHPVILYPLL
ncbi:hypothetical protein EXIGLDRAFT_473565 [Exidia glandulosa HHB12029]|uniref:Uncharacterized protein n=1 Tax=Exidia glandulosa HHB12029 TaxID=1314781 RepID=A0A165ASL0_EXIGL|nr:hypothetical protein EXIGLDRAFT_473565 [Exidia glandulosa HHB12029]